MEEKLLEQILSEIKGINKRLDNMDSRFDQVDSRLDRVESRLDQVEKRLDSVEKKVEGLESGHKELYLLTRSLEEKTGVISGTLVRVEERLTHIEGTVTNLSK